MKTVVVGMSGGVDSSLSALLLKQQGFRVIGLFMKNWEEKGEDGVCKAAEDFLDVQRVAAQIDIPCYNIQFVQEYWDLVFASFLEGIQQGLTPNPDILCNREIIFHLFFQKAKALGADFVATGHYCQKGEVGNHSLLLKGHDPGKDQSYFLYTMQQTVLKDVLFPIGHLEKKEARRLAALYDLPTATKKDSTGICFIGKRDFSSFLAQYLKKEEGTFQTLDGRIVGYHQGAIYYTIGQRKGLGIGGKGEAWFVVDKDVDRGIVFVVQGENHPALFRGELTATSLSWVHLPPDAFPFFCHAKIRYRQEDQPCWIDQIIDGIADVRFETPQRAITPGQSIVFYEDNLCLGGGVISPHSLSAR